MSTFSEIHEILVSGRSARDDETLPVSDEEFDSAERQLSFQFPQSYREFVRLGGLAERRINHVVLSPAEIVENLSFVDSERYIPFADNGCGDLYCWPRAAKEEPPVLFLDHESGSASSDSGSFTLWLRSNRF